MPPAPRCEPPPTHNLRGVVRSTGRHASSELLLLMVCVEERIAPPPLLVLLLLYAEERIAPRWRRRRKESPLRAAAAAATAAAESAVREAIREQTPRAAAASPRRPSMRTADQSTLPVNRRPTTMQRLADRAPQRPLSRRPLQRLPFSARRQTPHLTLLVSSLWLLVMLLFHAIHSRHLIAPPAASKTMATAMAAVAGRTDLR
jgi:hypothetical protein